MRDTRRTQPGYNSKDAVGNRTILLLLGCACIVCVILFLACIVCVLICMACISNQETPVAPNIEIASMGFTVRNITKTRLTAHWDLLISVPKNLPDVYICPQGEIQASFFYKNIALVTSSAQRYNDLKYGSAKQIRVLVEEDIGGLIGINIIKDIKDKREVKFGSHLFLTDCRSGTTGVMSYACDETMLQFESGSETKATKFGNNPTCFNF